MRIENEPTIREWKFQMSDLSLSIPLPPVRLVIEEDMRLGLREDLQVSPFHRAFIDLNLLGLHHDAVGADALGPHLGLLVLLLVPGFLLGIHGLDLSLELGVHLLRLGVELVVHLLGLGVELVVHLLGLGLKLSVNLEAEFVPFRVSLSLELVPLLEQDLLEGQPLRIQAASEVFPLRLIALSCTLRQGSRILLVDIPVLIKFLGELLPALLELSVKSRPSQGLGLQKVELSLLAVKTQVSTLIQVMPLPHHDGLPQLGRLLHDLNPLSSNLCRQAMLRSKGLPRYIVNLEVVTPGLVRHVPHGKYLSLRRFPPVTQGLSDHHVREVAQVTVEGLHLLLVLLEEHLRGFRLCDGPVAKG